MLKVVTAAAFAMVWMVIEPVLGAQAASASPSAPVQTIMVDVRGPLALVQIDRPVELGRAYGMRSSDEVVLDLALPPGARLQDAELRGGDGEGRRGCGCGPAPTASLATRG